MKAYYVWILQAAAVADATRAAAADATHAAVVKDPEGCQAPKVPEVNADPWALKALWA